MPTSAKTKFMELLGSMKMAIEVRPVGPNTMRLTPARPQTIPPAQPPIMDAIKGFFRRRFTPYRAGSVVPRRALQPVEIAREAIAYAEKNGHNVVILDTAGRLHVDEDMMAELKKMGSSQGALFWMTASTDSRPIPTRLPSGPTTQ